MSNHSTIPELTSRETQVFDFGPVTFRRLRRSLGHCPFPHRLGRSPMATEPGGRGIVRWGLAAGSQDPVSYADTHSKRRKREDEMADDPKEPRERAPQLPFAPYPALPPHTHEWVAGRCACGFRLLRSGMMVKYPGPRNSCGCECHYATDGAERPLAEFRVKYLSRVTAQQSGYALRDLCRGCYREMRHADRVAHFVNW